METLERTPTLLATDRCDRCGSQAYVETEHEKSNLYWCVHHYRLLVEKVLPLYAVVTDDRWILDYKPTL